MQLNIDATDLPNFCWCFRERKRGLELSVSRTPQQEAEENAILEQAATIQAARKAELQAQRKAAAPPPAGATLPSCCVRNTASVI